MNRSIAPEVFPIQKFAYPGLDLVNPGAEIPVYRVHDENSAVLKLEFVFKAGTRHHTSPFEAQTANALISEGTSKSTGAQIAARLDEYGSYIQHKITADDASLILYCLPKFLPACLEVLAGLLSDAIYPDNELVIFKANSLQRLRVNESRNGYLTRRAFNALVYGNTNAYGAPVYQADIENISRETVLGFYQKHYAKKPAYVLVSGMVNEQVAADLQVLIAQFNKPVIESAPVACQQSLDAYTHIQNQHAVQSTIRTGRLIPGRKDPDFRKLQVLNLILGGYFGSRLMSSIREEKGLTYGIYSMVDSNLDAGAFYIETDLNNELVDEGLNAIRIEIQKLLDEPVGINELKIAKNYYLGSFLRSLDGPFSIADRAKILIDFGLDSSYYEMFLEIIQDITALELQQIAQRWLQPNDLITVVTGKK